MEKRENAWNRILDMIEAVLSIAIGAAMIIVTLMIVIWRYVLNAPLTWGEEAARYLTVWFVYIGVAIGAKRSSHLGVEAFTLMMPEKVRSAVKCIAEIFTVFAFIFLAYWGIRMAMQYAATSQVSTMMRIPMAAVFCIIPIGLALAAYHYACQLVKNIGHMKHEKEAEE